MGKINHMLQNKSGLKTLCCGRTKCAWWCGVNMYPKEDSTNTFNIERVGTSNLVREGHHTEQGVETELKYNRLSITGFVLSIISIFGIGLAGIIGFILGIVALTQIKYTQNEERVWQLQQL